MSALFTRRCSISAFSFRSTLITFSLKQQQQQQQINSVRFLRRYTTRTYKSRKWKLGMGLLGGSLLCLSIPLLREEHELFEFKNKPPEGRKIERGPYKIPISRKVDGPKKLDVKLTLFQYQSCPFCCKVRAFLDYYGVPYDVVEVGPVWRSELHFSEYKKVPIVVVEEKPRRYLQLNDSSAIISVLRTYFLDPDQSFDDVLEKYPVIVSEPASEKEKQKKEMSNRYHVMFGERTPSDTSFDDIREEIRWRKWTDEVLVHALSPNIYRTPAESYESFRYFCEVGDWKRHFGYFERQTAVLLGSAVMYLVGKRLKSRHGLKDDVRESLYEHCRLWTKAVAGRKFKGGDRPDLADLAVFGVLNSIEGCRAFRDLLENTEVGEWYRATREAVSGHAGHPG